MGERCIKAHGTRERKSFPCITIDVRETQESEINVNLYPCPCRFSCVSYGAQLQR